MKKDINNKESVPTYEELLEYINKLEEELSSKNLELQEVKTLAKNAGISNIGFISNMSHELRTPLNVIIGFSEALVEGVYGKMEEQHRDYVNEIYKSSTKLLILINEIIDLCKTATGASQLEYNEFVINDVVNSSLYLFQEKAKKHSIKISTKIENEIGTIIADENKVKHVMVNLLSSAICRTPDGGSIRIILKKEDDEKGRYLRISVEDSGSAIGDDEKKIIFWPFSNNNGTVSSFTAAGLVLSRRFIEMHGGHIWIDSPISGDSGSRFNFKLPYR